LNCKRKSLSQISMLTNARESFGQGMSLRNLHMLWKHLKAKTGRKLRLICREEQLLNAHRDSEDFFHQRRGESGQL